MKKLIFLLIILVTLCSTTMAQDTYYYSSGEKIPLQVDSQRLVTITPITEARPILTNGFELLSSSNGDKNHHRIYQYDNTIYSPTQARSLARQANQSVSAVQPCYVDRNGTLLAPNGYIYIKLKSIADTLLLQNILIQYQLEVVSQPKSMPLWYSLRQLPTSNLSAVDVANELYETGLFDSVSPSLSCNILEITYDEKAHEQWNFYNREYEDVDISVSSAWNYATGKGIVIAIVDCGVDTTHNDLSANIHPFCYDTEMKDSIWMCYNIHATCCAGIAAAVRNNGIGIAGVAPDAKIMTISNQLEASQPNNDDCEMELADGIFQAWKHGADIISCSWKCSVQDCIKAALDSALLYGRNGKGCIIVKSAGNMENNNYNITFPGTHNGVLTIGNITKNGTRAEKSCYGNNLLAVAPGTDIWSTTTGNSMKICNGTSFAAPHVSGIAALILERNPNLTANQVREIIARNTTKVGGESAYSDMREFGSWRPKYGYGLVNAYEAVKNTPLITFIPITN